MDKISTYTQLNARLGEMYYLVPKIYLLDGDQWLSGVLG